MPKYLVTSGSHFTPFTYDELVKPVAHMQQAHDAAQDAYDTLNLETSALQRYITDNPGDSQAKAMYDNYMEKLSTLQNNLWEKGYNAQTRRDLAAARGAYASDITRLGKAIQNRQERSKEYWDAKHKNPDLVMGEDPALGGLNNYLADDNYGRNYFSYSGDQFMKEVGTDAQARANEMVRDPQIMKDPRMAGYLTRITQEGFTSQEVQNAGAAVRMALAGNENALSGLDPASGILANILMSHLNSTGARGKVSNEEFNRLFDYGMSGLSQAIGKRKIDDMRDLVWAENMERSRWAWQQNYKAAQERAKKQAEMEASIKMEDTDTNVVTGPNAKRSSRRLHRRGYDTTQTTLKFTKDGREVRNGVDASEIVYGGDIRREGYSLLGFDVGRTPVGSSTDRYLQGVVSMNGKTYRTRYNPNANGKKGAVEYSESGRTGTWSPSPRLTEIYNEYRSKYLDNYNKYKDSEIGKLATIDPDKQFKDYDRYGVPFSTPLQEFRSEAMDSRANSTSAITTTYVARKGTDSGKYVQKFADYISSGLTFKGDDARRDPNRRTYKGFSTNIHPVTEYGTLERRAIKDPDNVFKIKDGKITNISEIKITPDSILDAIDNGAYGDGYIIAKLDDNKEYGIGIGMMNSDVIKTIFMQARQKMLRDINNPYLSDEAVEANLETYCKEASYLMKTALGYSLNTVSEGGTSKDNLN